MDCKVCLEPYNHSERRPRALPCGHSFCAKCLESIFRGGALECPNCRASHPASDTSQFPFAFELEELILRLETLSASAPPWEEESPQAVPRECPSPPPPPEDAPRWMGSKLAALRDEQRDDVLRGLSDCEEMLSQVSTHGSSISNLTSVHENAMKHLRELMNTHEQAAHHLTEKKQKNATLREEGADIKSKLSSALRVLETASSAEEAGLALDEAEECLGRVRGWVRRTQAECGSEEAVGNFEKAQAETKTTLEAIMQEMFTIDVPRSTIWPLTTELKKMVLHSEVVAIQQKDGWSRYARVTTDGDAICLHHLKNQPPLTEHIAIPYESLMARLDAPSSALTFLDLSWPLSPPRRVYIRMEPKWRTDLARQFVLMCAAHLGPTYAHTGFRRVWTRDGDVLEGGDYDGRGGTGVVEGVGGAAVEVPCRPGLVGGFVLRTTFMVAINGSERCAFSHPFGIVERGLGILKAAAGVENIKQVTVVDCGVVV